MPENILYPLLTALTASVICSIVGVFVVLKRLVFISGGVSHAAFGGIGICIYLGISEYLGAFVAAILFAVLLGLFHSKRLQSNDTMIGILWVIGVATGAFFISLNNKEAHQHFESQAKHHESHEKTGESQLDPDSEKIMGDHDQVHHQLEEVLFGDILKAGKYDFYFTFLSGIAVLAVVMTFYRSFAWLSFDEEFARSQGMPVAFLNVLLMLLVSITVVLVIKVVGVTLTIALLAVPPAISLSLTREMKMVFVLSIFFGSLVTVSGILISVYFDIPAGPSIIFLGALLFLFFSFPGFLPGKRKVV